MWHSLALSEMHGGGTKYSWSNNEYFAHKKNVGEEARLRNTLHNINQRYSLVKDTLKHDISQVKTNLKSLRKSTGHCIEASPPTPFRVTSSFDREATVISHLKRKSTSAYIPVEFNYVLEDVVPGGDGLDDEYRPINLGNESSIDGCSPHIPTWSQESTILPEIEGHQSRTVTTYKGWVTDQNVVAEGSNFLSASLKRKAIDNKSNRQTPQSDIRLPTIDGAILGREPTFENEKSTSCPSRLWSGTKDGHNDFKADSPRSARETRAISAVSRELSSILTEGEKKKRLYQHRNSFMVAENEIVATLQKEEGAAKKEREFLNTRKPNIGRKNNLNANNSTKQMGKSNGRNGVRNPADARLILRDARTRCRTCLERFRQNLAFQYRKTEQEAEKAENKAEVKAMEKTCLTITDDELDSMFSDMVLDFRDIDYTHARPYRPKRVKKGYSRARLEQLAEPRRGRRRKTLFSKHIIKTEVEQLMERHAQPQLTDREKERLRKLDSKIRMFLAVMQNELVPSTMVHIPQREDIMKVDISHL